MFVSRYDDDVDAHSDDYSANNDDYDDGGHNDHNKNLYFM